MSSFSDGLQTLFIQMVPFLMAVVFHEFAHGFVANRFGDATAKNSGRLTLNPVPHIDPIGTLLFPMVNMLSGTGFLIGWAKPVPINPNRFSSYRKGLFWVSFAGPLMNFSLAILAAISCYALQAFMPADFYLFEPLVRMAFVSVPLNFALGFFNLIPLPPLDGSKMIESFLSYEATRKYEAVAQYSFWILMALLISGALSVMSIPIHAATTLTFNLTAILFNMPMIGG